MDNFPDSSVFTTKHTRSKSYTVVLTHKSPAPTLPTVTKPADTPSATLPPARKMTLFIDMFDGANARDWLKSFQRVMLSSQVTASKTVLRFFESYLKSESDAEYWYETEVPASAKGSWDTVEPIFKARWCTHKDSVQQRLDALGKLMKMRLMDSDVCKLTPQGGTALHVRWCTEMDAIARKVPKDTSDSTKLAALKANIGPHTKRLLESKGALDSFKAALEAIRDLGEADQDEIRRGVRLDSLAAYPFPAQRDVTARQAPAAWTDPALSPSTPPMNPRQWSSRQPPQQRAEPYDGPGTAAVGMPGGPGASSQTKTAPRVADPGHQKALDDWYRATGGVVTPANPPPITPGTLPAGSTECCRCGTKQPYQHLYKECPGAFPEVPQVEQRWRFMVSQMKRERAQAQRADMERPGPTSQANATPLGVRAVFVQSEDDDRAWLGSSTENGVDLWC